MDELISSTSSLALREADDAIHRLAARTTYLQRLVALLTVTLALGVPVVGVGSWAVVRLVDTVESQSTTAESVAAGAERIATIAEVQSATAESGALTAESLAAASADQAVVLREQRESLTALSTQLDDQNIDAMRASLVLETFRQLVCAEPTAIPADTPAELAVRDQLCSLPPLEVQP